MVTELVKAEKKYHAAFRAMRHARPTAAWAELVRGSAMDRFEQFGFPTIASEDWKYTNLATFLTNPFTPVVQVDIADDLRERIPDLGHVETQDTHVVVVNGFFSSELSSLSGLRQVVVMDLFEAIADARFGKIAREFLARNANYH